MDTPRPPQQRAGEFGLRWFDRTCTVPQFAATSYNLTFPFMRLLANGFARQVATWSVVPGTSGQAVILVPVARMRRTSQKETR